MHVHQKNHLSITSENFRMIHTNCTYFDETILENLRNLFLHVCVYACIMHAWIHGCMYACMYACMHVCMYAFFCFCYAICIRCSLEFTTSKPKGYTCYVKIQLHFHKAFHDFQCAKQHISLTLFNITSVIFSILSFFSSILIWFDMRPVASMTIGITNL